MLRPLWGFKRNLGGGYYLARKSGNFSLKSNGKFIFRKFFGNCRVPSEALLFFHSEWNSGNFLTISSTFQFPVSHQPKTITRNQIANGKAPSCSVGLIADLGKALTIVQRSSSIFRKMVSTQNVSSPLSVVRQLTQLYAALAHAKSTHF